MPANRLVVVPHAPIAELFGTGIGFKLMLIESEILVRALEHFAQKGITALPLHDSVLVGRSAKVCRCIVPDHANACPGLLCLRLS